MKDAMCTPKLITGTKNHTVNSADIIIQFLRVGNCAIFIPVIDSNAPENPIVVASGDTAM